MPRRSLRLPTYDYRKGGAYFVTLCTHERASLLSRISSGRLRLCPWGEQIMTCWAALPDHFPHVVLDAFVVMPDHVHGVVWIRDDHFPAIGAVGARHASPLHTPGHSCRSGSLGAVVGAFKSASTRAVNLARGTPGAPLWQRNYYERVVRSAQELDAIRRYIAENPARWACVTGPAPPTAYLSA